MKFKTIKELKEFINTLDESLLNNPVLVELDEKCGQASYVEVLKEDLFFDEEYMDEGPILESEKEEGVNYIKGFSKGDLFISAD